MIEAPPRRRSLLPLLLPGLLAGLLAACSAAPPPPRPAVLDAMRDLDQQALSAVRENRLALAAQIYARLLRRQQSIDNLDGIAVTSINLASVLHGLKRDEEAERLLEALLREEDGLFPAARKGEAAFRLAVLRLDQGDSRRSAETLALARDFCPATATCGLQAGLANLEARLALAAGAPERALALTATPASPDAASPEEEANRNRLRAAALAALGREAEALEGWRQTLERDKQLARSRHIAEDLEEIAALLERRGETAAAETWRRRARTVRDAGQ